MLLLLTSQVLLQSDKVPANFSDRSLLKNLGHWLGLQTLARNKPILMKVLNDVCFDDYGSLHVLLKANCNLWCLFKESIRNFTGLLCWQAQHYNTSYVELCVGSWKVIYFSCRILIWSHWLLKLTSKGSRYVINLFSPKVNCLSAINTGQGSGNVWSIFLNVNLS